ncbi:hypothetical protein [Frankia sp. CiP1_Cm_nod1]|uniref:hypothetical protein n=1 Tax=Frankia sp. CiP1_Cm_nod1 TaxID=2897160 RepID=UPI0020249099
MPSSVVAFFAEGAPSLAEGAVRRAGAGPGDERPQGGECSWELDGHRDLDGVPRDRAGL